MKDKKCLRIANDIHFFIVSYSVCSCFLKIKIDCKGQISHVLERKKEKKEKSGHKSNTV